VSRIFQLEDVLLFRTPPVQAGANNGRNIAFLIPTPSARIMAKIALFFWPSVTGQQQDLTGPPASTIDFTQAGAIGNITLVLYTAEQAETGWYIPTGNLVGALEGLAGQPIPAAAPTLGNAGFSIDVQGGQDAVGGYLQIPATAGYGPAAGRSGFNLSLRVRYEQQGTDMCESEWLTLVPKLQISAPAQPLVWT
jgi:hypothetical protein